MSDTMPELLPALSRNRADNLSHNILAQIDAAQNRLSDLATLYLVTEVAGQSHETLAAKRRDLQRFLTFYQHLYGHDRPEEWFVSVTKAFLKHLQRARLAQASLVRIYATVRHFARWLARKFSDLFPLGCPTEGVKPPAEPAADWKGLTRVEEIRLLSAAQTLRVRPGPGTASRACASPRPSTSTGSNIQGKALPAWRSRAAGCGTLCRCSARRARCSRRG